MVHLIEADCGCSESDGGDGLGYDTVNYVLEVEFADGRLYQYYDVPEAVHAEFMGSGSLGSYLNNYIKAQYRFMRL